jgi:PAS domain S-box-containing protein
VPANRASFRGILDSIGSPVVAVKRNLHIMYCNDLFAEIMDRSVEDLMGQPLLTAIPELAGTETHSAYLEVLSSRRAVTVKTTYGNRVFRERVYPTPWGALSIAEEITEEEREAQLFRGPESDLRAIFDNTSDGLLVVDPFSGDILEANPAALEMFAASHEQLLRLNVRDLAAGDPPYTKDDFLRVVKKAFYTSMQPMEWEARDRSGRVFWVEVRVRRVELANQDRLLVILRDITEHKQLESSLRESDERFRDLIDNAHDMIYVHDLEGNFTFVNKAAERLTGYWREELLKMNIEQLAAPDYLQLLRSLVYRRKAKIKENTFELEILTRYGERVYLEISAWPLYKAGKPVAVQGIARNVTERRQAEAALMAAEQDARHILDNLPDATLVINAEGKVVLWNKAMEALTGVKAEEMLGKGNFEYGIPFYGVPRPLLADVVLHPEEVEKYYSVYQYENYVLVGETDATHLRGKGQYLWGTAAPLYDRQGNLVGAVECLRDMTEQRRRREALTADLAICRQQEQLLRCAVDSLGAMVMTVDTHGAITYASPSVQQLLGHPADEVVCKQLTELVAPESRQRIQELLEERLPQLVQEETELTLVHSDGSPRVARATVKPLCPVGDIQGAVVIFSRVAVPES